MARLPVPGQDSGSWGDILNEFLSVELTSGGALKARTDNSFVGTSGAQTVAGTKTFSASPVVPTPTLDGHATTKLYVDSTVSAGAPDATAGTKGILQLTGDLGGTAASPTVPGLAGKEATANKGAASGYAPLNSSSQVPLANLSDATASAKGIVQLTGDLGGTAASPTVPGLAGKEATANKGAASGYAPLNSSSQVPLANLSDATGSAKGIVQLTGDLGGTAASPTVPGLAGKESTANKGAASGYAPLNSSSIVPVANLPDATGSVNGILRLAGDLGGTAASPTVPGLAGKEATANKGAVNGYAPLNSSTQVAISYLPVPFTQANSHASPDTDSGPTALHHTLGTGANQAAAGNHTHGGGGSSPKTEVWAWDGTLQTMTGTGRWYNRTGSSMTINGVWASAGTAPTGAAILVDVNKNGTTIFTTQGNRPTVASGGNGGTLATPDVTTLADGDYLTVDIDQVGSTNVGAVLSVGVILT